MEKNRFRDRVVLITGAASGIGLATARRIGREGGRIVLVDRDQGKLDAAEHELQSSGAAAVLSSVCDVREAEQVKATISRSLEHFGKIDAIINNAGVMIFKPLVEHTVADWTNVLSVDLVGAFLFIQHGFLVMQPGSCIVNVSSVHAVETTPLVASYAAAKAALLSLTRSGRASSIWTGCAN